MQRFLSHIALLLGLWGLGLLPGLGRVVVEQEKELRVLLTARGMVERGDWLVPEYRGEIRLKKPPLMYWIVAGAYSLVGSTESLLAGRIPGVLLAAGLIVAIYGCGARWIGRKRALFAAGVAASSWMFLEYGRIASADVPLSLFVFLALHAGYRAVTQPGRLRHWMLLGLYAGLGFLVKGVAALGIPLAVVLVFALGRRRFRGNVKFWGALWTLALFALLALPWYAVILFYPQTKGIADTVLEREMVQTFGGRGHPGSIVYYVYQLPVAMLPWGLLLPVAAVRAWRPARRHAGLGYLLMAFGVTFVLLSLTTAKQVHYNMLLLPTGALLVGWLAAPRRVMRPAWPWRISRGYVAALLVILALGGVGAVAVAAAPPKGVVWPSGSALWAGVTLAAGALAGLAIPGVRSYRGQVWTVCGLAALAGGIYHAQIADGVTREALSRDLALKARERLPRDARVYGVGEHLAVVEFYLHRRVEDAPDLGEAWKRAQPGDAVVRTTDPRKAGAAANLPVPPALALTNARWSCVLWEKPGASRAP